eukprot:4818307-Amphidinium_carterae.1
MVILRRKLSHGFERGTIKSSLNALEVRPSLDHIIHDVAVALSDYKVVYILPSNLSTRCAEASKRRPPSEPSAEGLEVSQGAASTPPLGRVSPLSVRGRPLLTRKKRTLPGPYGVEVECDLRVSLQATLER